VDAIETLMRRKAKASLRRFHRRRVIKQRTKSLPQWIKSGKRSKNKPSGKLNPRKEFRGKNKSALTLQELRALQSEPTRQFDYSNRPGCWKQTSPERNV